MPWVDVDEESEDIVDDGLNIVGLLVPAYVDSNEEEQTWTEIPEAT